MRPAGLRAPSAHVLVALLVHAPLLDAAGDEAAHAHAATASFEDAARAQILASVETAVQRSTAGLALSPTIGFLGALLASQ